MGFPFSVARLTQGTDHIFSRAFPRPFLQFHVSQLSRLPLCRQTKPLFGARLATSVGRKRQAAREFDASLPRTRDTYLPFPRSRAFPPDAPRPSLQPLLSHPSSYYLPSTFRSRVSLSSLRHRVLSESDPWFSPVVAAPSTCSRPRPTRVAGSSPARLAPSPPADNCASLPHTQVPRCRGHRRRTR